MQIHAMLVSTNGMPKVIGNLIKITFRVIVKFLFLELYQVCHLDFLSLIHAVRKY
jgi:hypothetical protein